MYNRFSNCKFRCIKANDCWITKSTRKKWWLRQNGVLSRLIANLENSMKIIKSLTSSLFSVISRWMPLTYCFVGYALVECGIADAKCGQAISQLASWIFSAARSNKNAHKLWEYWRNATCSKRKRRWFRGSRLELSKTVGAILLTALVLNVAPIGSPQKTLQYISIQTPDSHSLVGIQL